jgi:hypothetical protein
MRGQNYSYYQYKQNFSCNFHGFRKKFVLFILKDQNILSDVHKLKNKQTNKQTNKQKTAVQQLIFIKEVCSLH